METQTNPNEAESPDTRLTLKLSYIRTAPVERPALIEDLTRADLSRGGS